jgi:hypothetical protein
MNIATILAVLNDRKVRATYSAVGELMGVHPKLVRQHLGTRRPEASWVVSKSTGMPTGYLDANCHKDLQKNPHIIATVEELANLIEHCNLSSD